MRNHNDLALYEENGYFYDEDIVTYVRFLIEIEDYVTLSSIRKPSLSEYDAFET